MPEVVVSDGCLNIAAQDGASWQHQNHGEGAQQQAWQICFAGVNHKSMKGEPRVSQNFMRLVLGPVANHRDAIRAAARLQLAAQPQSVLSQRVAMPLNSLIPAK